MAKLYFRYGAMGSSKTANAIMVQYNYEERGQKALMVKPALENRDGAKIVASRSGLQAECTFIEDLTLEEAKNYDCIIVDEAQFLTKNQVQLLVDIVDKANVPVICYGLPGGFPGQSLRGQPLAAGLSRFHRGNQNGLLVRKKSHLQRAVVGWPGHQRRGSRYSSAETKAISPCAGSIGQADSLIPARNNRPRVSGGRPGKPAQGRDQTGIPSLPG